MADKSVNNVDQIRDLIFGSQIKEFEERFNRGELVMSFEITNFLKSWLKDHIQGTDKKYSEFLISKGVK